MPAPALKIPVEVNLDTFRQGMDKASSGVGETLSKITNAFSVANNNLSLRALSTFSKISQAGGGTLQTAAKDAQTLGNATLFLGRAALLASQGLEKAGDAALKLYNLRGFRLAAVTAAVGSVVALGGAVVEARRQLAAFLDIADKSSASGVSAEFFQAFISEARKAKVGVEELEGALSNAFNNLKPQAALDEPFQDIDRGLTGVEKKINSVATLLRDFHFELFDKSQSNPVFLREFEAAGNSVQGQIRAVLTAMIELNNIGQNLASLGLGEKVFGKELADRIRQGKTSAEEIRQSLDRPPANLFTQEQVDRAKEIDRQLKVAHDTLERNLRPAWEGLADVSLTIKSIWVDIVGLVAKAAGGASVFGADAQRRQRLGELDEVNRRLESGEATGLGRLTGSTGLSTAARGQLERRQQTLIKELGLFNQGFEPTFGPEVSAGVPLPRRRPEDAPKAREEGTAARDRFEASAESIERRTAAIEAETRNIDLGTEARERARIAADLETVAKQLNTREGINNGEVTAAQLEVINRVAEAYGKAAAAIEQARSPLATFARESANVTKQLNQLGATALDGLTSSLADVVTGSKSAAEAFNALAKSILNDLAKIAIRATITGPLAQLLGGAFGGTGGGGAPLIYGPGFASGTNFAPGGWSWVGERGPELVNLPRGSQVIPNDVAMRGGGGLNVQINNYASNDNDIQTSRSSGPDGEQLIISVMKKAMSSGQLDAANAGRFGVRTKKVR